MRVPEAPPMRLAFAVLRASIARCLAASISAFMLCTPRAHLAHGFPSFGVDAAADDGMSAFGSDPSRADRVRLLPSSAPRASVSRMRVRPLRPARFRSNRAPALSWRPA